MDFKDLAQALKLATPLVWFRVTVPSVETRVIAVRQDRNVIIASDISKHGNRATGDGPALTGRKIFTHEDREAVRFEQRVGVMRSLRKRRTYSSPKAPLVDSEASFLYLIEVTRNHLSEQHLERVNQARAAFIVALLALILGVVLVFTGIVCIFVISLPIGVVTAASSSISSIISALAFRFNKEANDRLDSVTKELSILDRASVAMHYISYIVDAEKKDHAITNLTEILLIILRESAQYASFAYRHIILHGSLLSRNSCSVQL